jgi:DNA-directed RNA polymerase subunit H (RpoH/RPB5)
MEIKQLKDQYKIEDLSILPIMLKTDPVCKYYGYLSGNICEIIRTNKGNKVKEIDLLDENEKLNEIFISY